MIQITTVIDLDHAIRQWSSKKGRDWKAWLIAPLKQFKQIRSSVSPEVQTELYGLLVQDLDAAVQKMIAIAAENNVSFTVEEVKSYLRELDEEDEFDDVTLNEATLAAVAGGWRSRGGCWLSLSMD